MTLYQLVKASGCDYDTYDNVYDAEVTVCSFDEGDEYDDGFVYEQNGAGDQFIKVDLGANFPLNFGSQLKIGGLVSLGYYRFLNQYFAVGGDLILGYNLSIGKKPLFSVPVTFGVMYQPYVGKFEFPVSLGIGFASTALLDKNYFPSLAGKVSAGVYYRISETWSFGLTSNTSIIPHWFIDEPKKNDVGIFTSINVSVRYHL